MKIQYWQVGGFVRDRLMGKKSKDLDYTVIAPSYEAMVAWIREQGEIYLETPQFWTVRAHLKDKLPADFVLARKDSSYSDGRRPDSVSVGTLDDDLARRDFTCNAIAYNEETGEYYDPHGGQEDIKKNLLRCVGKAEDRFHEDALRLLRAIRFILTKGFKWHYDIHACLQSPDLAKRLKDNVAVERKQEELHKCLKHDTLATLGLLGTYPDILKACFEDSRMWLMPTLKE